MHLAPTASLLSYPIFSYSYLNPLLSEGVGSELATG